MCTCIARGGDFPFNATAPKSARNDDALCTLEIFPNVFVLLLQLLAVHPYDLRFAPVKDRSGFDRFDLAQVRIIEVRVLAHQSDAHRFHSFFVALATLLPLTHIRLQLSEPEL